MPVNYRTKRAKGGVKGGGQRRPIYDENYYKVAAILRDSWFKEKVALLKRRFAETGCPLPKRPFKKYAQYMAWNDAFWKRYTELEKSPEMAAARTRITGDKTTMSSQEFYALEEFKESFLPPVYGQVFDDILEHFGIDQRDRRYYDFLEYHTFFGIDEYPTEPFKVMWRREKPGDPAELLVQIFGHTKREDFLRHWDWIAQEQKSLPDFLGKNKAWGTFERDMEIYDLYKKLREESGRKRAENSMKAVDKWIYSELHGKYRELTLQNIRTIVARTRERLGER